MRAVLLLLVWGCSLPMALGQAAIPPLETALPKPPPEEAPAQVAFSVLHVRFRPTAPVYPPLAKLAKIQGTVTLRLALDINGWPQKVEGVEGPKALQPAAEAFGKKWIFEPYQKNGKCIPVQTQVRVAFRLEDVPEANAPTPPVVVSVEEPSGGLLVPVNLAPAQKAAAENLEALGFPVLAGAKAGPENALSVLVRVRTLKTAQGVFVYELLGRLSLLKDRDITENEAGKPQRVWEVGLVLGQKGDAGLDQGVAAAVPNLLRELTAPRLPYTEQMREEWARAQVTPRPIELKKPAGLPVVDFDFSQIRVKYQPPAPRYPALAKANRIQGTAVVELTVDPGGHPVSAEAIQGPPELLVTALSYALQWEFEPARLNGVPRYSRFRLTMPFRLH